MKTNYFEIILNINCVEIIFNIKVACVEIATGMKNSLD